MSERMRMVLTDSRGESITFGLPEENDFFLLNWDGLSLPPFERRATPLAIGDGEIFEDNVIRSRMIDLFIEYRNNDAYRKLQRFMRHRERYLLAIERDGYRRYFIDCVLADTYEETGWARDIRIPLYCADPFFFTDVEHSMVVENLEEGRFAFYEDEDLMAGAKPPGEPYIFSVREDFIRDNVVVNTNQIANGIQARLKAYSSITNPKIVNKSTGKFIGFNITLSPGDLMVINTQQGQLTATVNGQSVWRNLIIGSSTLLIEPGGNMLSFQADNLPLMKMEISYRERMLAI